MSDSIVQIRNLCYSIGSKKILDNINADFEPGQIHGIVGPNGAGKSTLMRTICRIWEANSGTVHIAGRDQRQISRRELSQLVTLVPQESRIDFSIRVFDFVSMGRHPHLHRLQWLQNHDIEIIDQALRVTDTEHFRDRYINQLSGGESQLVSIARALVTEAPIILLDEPTSALDIQHKLQIMELLGLLKKQGKTILMNIHDLDLARRHCDTLTMLRQGQLYYQGCAEQAFSSEHIREVFNVEIEESTTAHGTSLLFYAQ
ncbi:MAG: ABC transporter ATP-binding protein [Deltaproteobacteria bacterium]|nr:ABC transporter ATP-binding protein [Deltaproteobacteria bacterium]